MAFKLKDGERVRLRPVAIASATVVPAGDFIGMTSGLAVDAVAATTAIAWCPAGSADGETVCYATVGNDFTLTGTGDAVFAVDQKGTEVDLTDTQLIDVGSSSTDVLKIGIGTDSGVVDSTDNIEVRINKPLF